MTTATVAPGVRMSELPAASSLAGTETTMVIQAGQSRRVPVDTLLARFGIAGTVTAEGSSAALPLARRFSYRKNVRDFGAVGDGVVDDTAAFQAAHDSLSTFGGCIEAPPGIYKLGTVNISRPTILIGVMGGAGGSVELKSNSATATMLNVTCSDFVLDNVKLSSSVARTSGAYVKVANAQGGSIRNVYSTGHYIGFDIDGVTEFEISNIRFFNGVAHSVVQGGSAIRLGFTAYTGVVDISRILVQCANYGLRPTAGITYGYVDVVNLHAVIILRAVTCGLVTPTAGQVAALIHATGCTFDTSDYGWQLLPTAGAQVLRCLFSQCYFGVMAQVGVVSSAPAGVGVIDGVRFTGCQFIGCTVVGLNADGAGNTNIVVEGGVVTGCGVGLRADNGATISYNRATIGISDLAGANTTDVVFGSTVKGEMIGNRFTTPTPTISNNSALILVRDNTPEGCTPQDPWKSFTSSVSSTTGALTLASGSGRYWRRGQTISFTASLVITTNGTGAGGIAFTLPLASKSPTVFFGRGTAVSGKSLQGIISANGTVVTVINFDGSYPAANGELIVITGTYEAA